MVLQVNHIRKMTTSRARRIGSKTVETGLSEKRFPYGACGTQQWYFAGNCRLSVAQWQHRSTLASFTRGWHHKPKSQTGKMSTSCVLQKWAVREFRNYDEKFPRSTVFSRQGSFWQLLLAFIGLEAASPDRGWALLEEMKGCSQIGEVSQIWIRTTLLTE